MSARHPSSLRGERGGGSAIVSYTHEDGREASYVGYGDSLDARVRDADAQLPGGGWTRVCVSTPSSIYSDLVGRDTASHLSHAGYRKYERVPV